MKKSRLLKSVIVLSLFYWLVGWVSYSFLLPNGVAEIMDNIPQWFLDTFKVAPFSKPPAEANFLEAAAFQWAGVMMWSLPVFMIWLGALLVGTLIAYVIYLLGDRSLHSRAIARGNFRGAGITRGSMPMPCIQKHSRISGGAIKIEGVKLNKEEQAFLGEVLGILRDNQHAYAGPGHGVGLYEHSMSVIDRALSEPGCDSNLVLAAACHDLGKITSYRKNSKGEWESFRLHAQESARLMAGMDTWWQLPEEQRETIRLACKYDHSPQDFPLSGNVKLDDGVRGLIQRLRDIDGKQTAAEKVEVKKRYGDMSEYLFRLFDEHLDRLPFNTTTSPKGAATVGLKKENRIFLFEVKLRERLISSVDKDLWASLGGDFRKSGEIHEFTEHLLHGLDREGWLVKTMTLVDKETRQPLGDVTAPTNKALWYGHSGTLGINGIIIVDVPPDRAPCLPITSTQHAISFYAYHKGEGPLRISAEAAMSVRKIGEEAATDASDKVEEGVGEAVAEQSDPVSNHESEAVDGESIERAAEDIAPWEEEASANAAPERQTDNENQPEPEPEPQSEPQPQPEPEPSTVTEPIPQPAEAASEQERAKPKTRRGKRGGQQARAKAEGDQSGDRGKAVVSVPRKVMKSRAQAAYQDLLQGKKRSEPNQASAGKSKTPIENDKESKEPESGGRYRQRPPNFGDDILSRALK